MPISSAARQKMHKVMKEYGEKELKSSSGKTVKKRKQAIAIGLSEAGLSKKKRNA